MTRTIDETTANGQTNPEYVTVILEICGIKEERRDESGRWISPAAERRKALEDLIELVKIRQHANTIEAIEAGETVENFRRIMDERTMSSKKNRVAGPGESGVADHDRQQGLADEQRSAEMPLKLCPICGQAPKEDVETSGAFSSAVVHCVNPDCPTKPGFSADTPGLARKAWMKYTSSTE